MITAALAAGACLAAPAAGAAPHDEHGDPVRVVAQGLDDPIGLSYRNGKFYAAENASGEVSGVVPGGSGPSVRAAGFTAPTGVDRTATELLTVTGEGEGPGSSTLHVSSPGVGPRPLADLAAHELAENPDGQRQFDEAGEALDALSNPFAVLGGRGGGTAYAYVADAGANAVLSVDRDGTVRSFFVPDLVTTGACEGAENNDPEHAGCDAVPTGLAWGPDGNLYVSGLSGEVPGEGRVYVVDPVSGELLEEVSGFDGPTGVAVGDDGALYVSEVLAGLPPEGPGPDTDLTAIGRIVRVDADGQRSTARVTMPLGLRWADGALHATARSLWAAATGETGQGQVVRVDASAFSAED
ncbi:ScyD/ScyE family protein [Kineococcus indalonis]|uniref:ScyD/ScyE family protein n=1 Tax=Kineococcus indalonis TaxID=2696566 RepID=UPI00141295C7|nr:ScyD/ScyE family protein [Kineococcus indalonis]NAZ86550.1 ScyD/ScyE family protein [Kineococcus indalonis]